MSLNTKKGIYGLFSVIAPIIGTACGVLGGIVFAVAHMYEPVKSELINITKHEIPLWTNAVHFTSLDAPRNFVGEWSVWLIVMAVVFTAAVIVLCILSGQFSRNEDNTIKLNRFDRIWTELQIAVLALACCGAVFSAAPFFKIVPASKWLDFYEPIIENNFVFDPMPNNTVIGLVSAAMLACIEISVLCGVSLVKKIKARKFLETALLGKTVIRLFGGIRNIWDKTTFPDENEGNTSRQLRLIYIAIPIAMVFLAMTWVGAVIDIIIILAFVPNKIKKYLDIRKGVAEVKSGDLAYQIEVKKKSAQWRICKRF